MAWDSSMRGMDEHKTDAELAHIIYSLFECKDTKIGIKFSIGGLYIYPYVRYVSEDALKVIKERQPSAIVKGCGIDHSKLKPDKLGVTFEHVIPIESTYQYFDGLFRSGKLTERHIQDVIPKLHLAVITNAQNKMITKAGYHSKMPSDTWHLKDGDPFERYRVSGLDNIWTKEFVS